jgi:4-hydroxy-4-methyl-2-oxoglutarate aldolase
MTTQDSPKPEFQALSGDQLDALRKLDTCTLANAVETTGSRLRNEGYVDSTVRCLFPELSPMVGYAIPIRVRTSEPPIAGRAYVDRVDWWDQLLAVPAPRILVVEDVQSYAGTGSFMGEVHAHIYRALGCAGIVTNGAVRDVPALRRMGFQAFVSHVSVSHAYAHVVEVGSPVVVGGLEVQQGDLLHGDLHGVLSIPRQVAGDLPTIAAKQKGIEQTIKSFCDSSGFNVEGLRQLLQQLEG